MATYIKSNGTPLEVEKMHPSYIVNALNCKLKMAVALRTRLNELDREAQEFIENPDNQGVEYYYGEQERKDLKALSIQIGELATELGLRGFALEARQER